MKDTSIVSALEAYDNAVHPVNEQLPLSTWLLCLQSEVRKKNGKVLSILDVYTSSGTGKKRNSTSSPGTYLAFNYHRRRHFWG